MDISESENQKRSKDSWLDSGADELTRKTGWYIEFVEIASKLSNVERIMAIGNFFCLF